jgi:16S rRNA (guanine527-N7)-methyltransferase
MRSSDAALLRAHAVLHGARLETAALERIDRFLDRLALWSRRIHLLSAGDREVALRKHTADCLAPLPFLPDGDGLVIDIGAGTGFPGVILGCVRPDLALVLVESRRRPSSFLREVVRAIPLPQATVFEGRAESAAADPRLRGAGDVVIARAVRIDVFLRLAAPLLRGGGTAIAMQTPRVSEAEAADHGRASRFGPARVRDYRLPTGERRRLFAFIAPGR